MKNFEKVEKTGIISTKFSLQCTASVILGIVRFFQNPRNRTKRGPPVKGAIKRTAYCIQSHLFHRNFKGNNDAKIVERKSLVQPTPIPYIILKQPDMK